MQIPLEILRFCVSRAGFHVEREGEEEFEEGDLFGVRNVSK